MHSFAQDGAPVAGLRIAQPPEHHRELVADLDSLGELLHSLGELCRVPGAVRGDLDAVADANAAR